MHNQKTFNNGSIGKQQPRNTKLYIYTSKLKLTITCSLFLESVQLTLTLLKHYFNGGCIDSHVYMHLANCMMKALQFIDTSFAVSHLFVVSQRDREAMKDKRTHYMVLWINLNQNKRSVILFIMRKIRTLLPFHHQWVLQQAGRQACKKVDKIKVIFKI